MRTILVTILSFLAISSVNAQTLAPLVIASGPYTIQSTDCDRLIQMGTGTSPQDTITLPPSLPVGCTIKVKNGDVWSGPGTGHAMTLAGFPSDLSPLLWPQQVAEITQTSTGPQTSLNPGRWKIPGLGNVVQICVAQNGNDANDGLNSGTNCMATLQNAVNVIGTQWDGGGYNSCAIGLYAGGTSTFSPATQTGQSVGCYLTYNVRGNITIAGAGSCFSNGDNAISIWNWNLGFIPTFACNTSNTFGQGVFYAHQTSIYDFNGGTAIWIPGGSPGVSTGSNDTFFYVDLQGSATFNARLNIGDGVNTFNPLTFVFCEAHCSKVTASGTVAFSPHVTMGVAFALRAGSVITTNLSWLGATVSQPSTPTGGSVLIINGTTIPGGTSPVLTGPSFSPAQNSIFGIVCNSVC